MTQNVSPAVRVGIMLVAISVIATLSYHFTGSVIPREPKQALFFQHALLLVVLGSALLEPHYTKPADSVVNSLMGLISLLSVYGQAPKGAWFIAAGYCFLVFLLSVSCVAASSGSQVVGWRETVSKRTYHPAVVLGRAQVLFTVVFLFGLWFFYSAQDEITLALVIFWGVFIAIWPLKIPALITSWFEQAGPKRAAVGEIIRIDDPNILRIALNGSVQWTESEPKVCTLPNGKSQWVVPLYSQFQKGGKLATGLLTGITYSGSFQRENCVFEPEDTSLLPQKTEINEALGGGPNSSLIGFVVEKSSIGIIQFETLNSNDCCDGMLVWTLVAGQCVYYQVVAGETQEESFSSDKHGFQVASATQLGTLEEQSGFKKQEWLPAMNAPVFTAAAEQEVSIPAVKDGDFPLGVIPKSQIMVGGNFSLDYNYHTAILGVTGSGKTELAFDLISHALEDGIKVVCIDLTAQYEDRLAEHNPVDLSIKEERSKKLSQKLFDVETGPFKAQNEKIALEEFAKDLRGDVVKSIEEFFTGQKNSNLGLICLEEISNTRATLWITELYMTCLLKYARDNLGNCPRVLIVVEEAHTVMPEPNTMGLGDFESRGLVGKIGQIALQGRKYGVGLLVLAQRTATVSKTVLTQCNTIISFAAYDDTSLAFLSNIFGQEYVSLIPNLPSLHAVAFGKWVRSEKPIVFQVPFKEMAVKDNELQNISKNHLVGVRKKFWKQLIQAMSVKSALFKKTGSLEKHWISTGAGVSSVRFEFVVTKSCGRAELYIDRGAKEENEFIFDHLFFQKAQIEEAFGGSLEWERLDKKKACRIKVETQGNVLDRDQWQTMIDFMVDAMICLERAIKAPLHQVVKQLKETETEE